MLYGVYCGGAKPGMRCVKKGDWKLIKYDSPRDGVRETQLFNLAEDPEELLDRAGDPACATVLQLLTERVLADWDPTWIQGRLAAKGADLPSLPRWAEQTEPAETIRWPMRPEMNFLEEF